MLLTHMPNNNTFLNILLIFYFYFYFIGKCKIITYDYFTIMINICYIVWKIQVVIQCHSLVRNKCKYKNSIEN